MPVRLTCALDLVKINWDCKISFVSYDCVYVLNRIVVNKTVCLCGLYDINDTN